MTLALMKKGYSVEEDFLLKVGEKIKHYRALRGLSLRELGEDIGLDKGNTHRIENGKNLTLITLFKLAAILEIEPKDLLDFAFNYKIEDVEKLITEKKEKRVNSNKPAKKVNYSKVKTKR